jgi:hypothetical protein
MLITEVCRVGLFKFVPVVTGLVRALAARKCHALVREVNPLPAKAAAVFSFRFNQIVRFHAPKLQAVEGKRNRKSAVIFQS